MLPEGIPAQVDTDAALISKPEIATTTAVLLTIFIVHSFFSDSCAVVVAWYDQLLTETQPEQIIDCSDPDFSHSAVDYRDTPHSRFIPGCSNSPGLGVACS